MAESYKLKSTRIFLVNFTIILTIITLHTCYHHHFSVKTMKKYVHDQILHFFCPNTKTITTHTYKVIITKTKLQFIVHYA